MSCPYCNANAEDVRDRYSYYQCGTINDIFTHKSAFRSPECFKSEILHLKNALREFCQRVERGEIKSERTYRKFKELLGEPIK